MDVFGQIKNLKVIQLMMLAGVLLIALTGGVKAMSREGVKCYACSKQISKCEKNSDFFAMCEEACAKSGKLDSLAKCRKAHSDGENAKIKDKSIDSGTELSAQPAKGNDEMEEMLKDLEALNPENAAAMAQKYPSSKSYWTDCLNCSTELKKCESDAEFFKNCKIKCTAANIPDRLKKCRQAHDMGLQGKVREPAGN